MYALIPQCIETREWYHIYMIFFVLLGAALFLGGILMYFTLHSLVITAAVCGIGFGFFMLGLVFTSLKNSLE